MPGNTAPLPRAGCRSAWQTGAAVALRHPAPSAAHAKGGRDRAYGRRGRPQTRRPHEVFHRRAADRAPRADGAATPMAGRAGACPAGVLCDGRSGFHPGGAGPGHRDLRPSNVAADQREPECEAVYDQCGVEHGEAGGGAVVSSPANRVVEAYGAESLGG